MDWLWQVCGVGTAPTQTYASCVKDAGALLQSIFTIVALCIGGAWAWFLLCQKRQIQPRANVAHEITAVQLGNDEMMIHATIQVSNIGDVLVCLTSGYVRVQQIVPVAIDVPREFANEDVVRKEPDDVHSPTWEQIAWWPCWEVKLSWPPGDCRIEPGEIEGLHCEFVLPSTVKTIRLSSYLENVRVRDRRVGWRATSIHELSAAAELEGSTDTGGAIWSRLTVPLGRRLKTIRGVGSERTSMKIEKKQGPPSPTPARPAQPKPTGPTPQGPPSSRPQKPPRPVKA